MDDIQGQDLEALPSDLAGVCIQSLTTRLNTYAVIQQDYSSVG